MLDAPGQHHLSGGFLGARGDHGQREAARGAEQDAGETQKQLSKEFVRQWLIENGFQGQEGQQIPDMSDAWLETISARYIELYEGITGQPFVKADISDMQARVLANVTKALNELL